MAHTDPREPDAAVMKKGLAKRAGVAIAVVAGGLFLVSACQNHPPHKKGPPKGHIHLHLPGF